MIQQACLTLRQTIHSCNPTRQQLSCVSGGLSYTYYLEWKFQELNQRPLTCQAWATLPLLFYILSHLERSLESQPKVNKQKNPPSFPWSCSFAKKKKKKAFPIPSPPPPPFSAVYKLMRRLVHYLFIFVPPLQLIYHVITLRKTGKPNPH